MCTSFNTYTRLRPEAAGEHESAMSTNSSYERAGLRMASELKETSFVAQKPSRILKGSALSVPNGFTLHYLVEIA